MFLWPTLAVIVILAAVWFLGTRDAPGFASDDTVAALLRAEQPEFVPVEIERSTDGMSALVHNGAASLAIAFVVGSQRTSRLLSAGDIRSVSAQANGGGIAATIHTHDFGCPALRLELPADVWPVWQARLAALTGSPAAADDAHDAGAPNEVAPIGHAGRPLASRAPHATG